MTLGELDEEDVDVLDDELVAAPAGTGLSAASASASRDACTCLVWASQRSRASAYCFSHVSRCFSKPSSHSPVSGSKPSG